MDGEGGINVPKCSICDEHSTGIHFGAEACAACSAFFRRTIVLTKSYNCANAGKCKLWKRYTIGQLCRACRFERCLKVGMDKGAVQLRRDAIGQYSLRYETLKRSRQDSSSVSIQPSLPSRSSSCPSALASENILDEICSSYELYQKRRKVFYCNNSLVSLFDDTKELEPIEISDFRECIFQILRVEPRLCIEFIDSIKSLKGISCNEKAAIYSNFILKLQAIEEPYLTWKYGGLEGGGKFWMMQNRTYIDFDRISHYFSNDVMCGLNLDEKSAKNLFIPSFKHALELVGDKMATLNLQQKEMVAMIGIVLFDPAIPQLLAPTRQSLHSLRNRLFASMMELHAQSAAKPGNSSVGAEPPEVRMGNLILSLVPGIEIHSQRTRQNMHMLEIFNVVPRRDKLFSQITGIKGPPPVPLPQQQ